MDRMRILNSEEIHLVCDGGSACGGITKDAEIEYVLERIKKTKDGGLLCFNDHYEKNVQFSG